MEGLWDIHCHILPEVDDGAKDLEEALELLRKEYRDGVRNIVFTPHFRYEMFEPSLELVKQQFELVKEAASKDEHLSEMDLYLGTEIHVSNDMVDCLLNGERLTMADSKCVLLEFDPMEGKSRIRKSVKDLLGSGFLPIIAHAERIEAVRERSDFLEELKYMGALIQVNADSITGKEGFRMKWFCRKILKKGLVDFVASDGHNMTDRIPDLGNAYKKLEKLLGQDTAEQLLIHNPFRMIG